MVFIAYMCSHSLHMHLQLSQWGKRPNFWSQGSHNPFGNGARDDGIGKISGVLTKIGKFAIVLMYDVSIARSIQIIKLALVYFEKRERKKQV